MKVLITGGLGYIGSHTVVELSNKGIECIIIDNLSNSDVKVLDRIRKITKTHITFQKCDLLDRNSLFEVFERYRFDSVIHFAGMKSVGESVENPLKYYEQNLFSTINLLKAMESESVKKLVFSSSATVYGDLSKSPISEEMPTSTMSPYGRTKLIIEEILHDLTISDPEWSIAILRYFNPVGAHSSGMIGENPKGFPNNLMPYIAQVASGEKRHLNIFGDDYPTKDGTGVRDFIHVMDLASGHERALKYINSRTGCNVFNLGTGVGYSVRELIQAFEEINKVSIPYRVVDRRPGDIAESFADPSKAISELGWSAVRGIEEIVTDVWRWKQNMVKAGVN
ncbi:UDP-glucose 4-epimerase GalE [Sporosarcina koreensis]|uniref:UDP-glucose 4-epimerase n=1 Tax=Sporosarcina koreensis TaxID=334735 RepID=A0ABW0U2H9_9BACL